LKIYFPAIFVPVKRHKSRAPDYYFAVWSVLSFRFFCHRSVDEYACGISYWC